MSRKMCEGNQGGSEADKVFQCISIARYQAKDKQVPELDIFLLLNIYCDFPVLYFPSSLFCVLSSFFLEGEVLKFRDLRILLGFIPMESAI